MTIHQAVGYPDQLLDVLERLPIHPAERLDILLPTAVKTTRKPTVALVIPVKHQIRM
jgi:hypothetical protein